MRKEIKLPDIADNVETGYLSSILVKVGDVIEADQSIIEVETDKATTDIPTTDGGKVIDIPVHEGDEIKVGQTIIVLETSEGESEKGDDSKQEEAKGEEKEGKEEKEE